MAIFHLSMGIAKREGGKRSLIAMSAYRSGEKLYSELYEKTCFYQFRDIKPETFILKPEHVPKEFLDRETLWNKMELAEKSPNAQLCREINVALPIELDRNELSKQVELSEKNTADLSESNQPEAFPNIQIFQVIKAINRFLSNNQPKHKRNLAKLIKQIEKRSQR